MVMLIPGPVMVPVKVRLKTPSALVSGFVWKRCSGSSGLSGGTLNWRSEHAAHFWAEAVKKALASLGDGNNTRPVVADGGADWSFGADGAPTNCTRTPVNPLFA